MSRAEAQTIEAMLRNGPLDLGGPVDEQRALLDALMTGHPLPADTTLRDDEYGGVRVVVSESSAQQRAGTIVYFHGGAYALGSARGGAGLAAELTARTGVRAVSVEYRLAPEAPFPAAVDDAVAVYRALLAQGTRPEDVVVAGESAGGGLALAAVLALRDAGEPMPAAVIALSPWADLTVSSGTVTSRATLDAALTADALRTRAEDYLAGTDPRHPLASPMFADLAGLPPLLVQVGGDEILLGDSLAVATSAAVSDVEVTLHVVPHMPHVFQGFSGALTEAFAALDEVGRFVVDRLGDSQDHQEPEGN